jgi:hypothetical protein
MLTAVNSEGKPGAAPNSEAVLRAADRRRLERAAERRRRAERELDELVRDLFDADASAIELADVLGMTRHGVYRMVERARRAG